MGHIDREPFRLDPVTSSEGYQVLFRMGGEQILRRAFAPLWQVPHPAWRPIVSSDEDRALRRRQGSADLGGIFGFPGSMFRKTHEIFRPFHSHRGTVKWIRIAMTTTLARVR